MKQLPKIILFALLPALLLAVPTTAHAVPSATDQYTEQPPSPGGDGNNPSKKGSTPGASDRPERNNGSGGPGGTPSGTGNQVSDTDVDGNPIEGGDGESTTAGDAPNAGSGVAGDEEASSTMRSGVTPDAQAAKDAGLGWALPALMVVVLLGALGLVVRNRKLSNER